jgi:hypothetical protein
MMMLVSHMKLMGSFSTVFKSMISLPNDPKSARADQPIDIDLKAVVFERFINIISVTMPLPMINVLKFDDCRDMLTFAEQYEFDVLFFKIRNRMFDLTKEKGNSALLFLFASDRNDYQMGRVALFKIDIVELRARFPTQSASGNSFPEKVSQYLDKLRPEWRQQLKIRLFDHLLTLDSSTVYKWSSVAGDFSKPMPAPKRKLR